MNDIALAGALSVVNTLAAWNTYIMPLLAGLDTLSACSVLPVLPSFHDATNVGSELASVCPDNVPKGCGHAPGGSCSARSYTTILTVPLPRPPVLLTGNMFSTPSFFMLA